MTSSTKALVDASKLDNRSKATMAAAELLTTLADGRRDMDDARVALVSAGAALNVNSTLLLMATSPFAFEAGKHGLALLEAMRGDQPEVEVLRLYFELGQQLGFNVHRLAWEACVGCSDPAVRQLLNAAATLEADPEDFDDADARALLGAVASIIRSIDFDAGYDEEVSTSLLDAASVLEIAARDPGHVS